MIWVDTKVVIVPDVPFTTAPDTVPVAVKDPVLIVLLEILDDAVIFVAEKEVSPVKIPLDIVAVPSVNVPALIVPDKVRFVNPVRVDAVRLVHVILVEFTVVPFNVSVVTTPELLMVVHPIVPTLVRLPNAITAVPSVSPIADTIDPHVIFLATPNPPDSTKQPLVVDVL